MDGVNEVGEVKVSRLQMEGETAPEHKVEDKRRRTYGLCSVWLCNTEVSQSSAWQKRENRSIFLPCNLLYNTIFLSSSVLLCVTASTAPSTTKKTVRWWELVRHKLYYPTLYTCFCSFIWLFCPCLCVQCWVLRCVRCTGFRRRIKDGCWSGNRCQRRRSLSRYPNSCWGRSYTATPAGVCLYFTLFLIIVKLLFWLEAFYCYKRTHIYHLFGVNREENPTETQENVIL